MIRQQAPVLASSNPMAVEKSSIRPVISFGATRLEMVAVAFSIRYCIEIRRNGPIKMAVKAKIP